jgi:hypothetical protein
MIGHFNKNCPERRHNNMACQTEIFVAHVGEAFVYMMDEVQAHKTKYGTSAAAHPATP